MDNLVKKIFKIEGMNCASCAMVIDLDLEKLPGIKSSNTQFAKGITEVEFDPSKVSEQTILETIEKSGYKAHSDGE